MNVFIGLKVHNVNGHFTKLFMLLKTSQMSNLRPVPISDEPSFFCKVGKKGAS